MDVIADITPEILIIGFTMGFMELVKRYLNLPKEIWWLLIICMAVGFNYLMGLVGITAVSLEEAVKLGFVTSGLHGLGKAALERKGS